MNDIFLIPSKKKNKNRRTDEVATESLLHHQAGQHGSRKRVKCVCTSTNLCSSSSSRRWRICRISMDPFLSIACKMGMPSLLQRYTYNRLTSARKSEITREKETRHNHSTIWQCVGVLCVSCTTLHSCAHTRHGISRRWMYIQFSIFWLLRIEWSVFDGARATTPLCQCARLYVVHVSVLLTQFQRSRFRCIFGCSKLLYLF